MLTLGEGGVKNPPKSADVVYGRPFTDELELTSFSIFFTHTFHNVTDEFIFSFLSSIFYVRNTLNLLKKFSTKNIGFVEQLFSRVLVDR